MWYQDFGEGEAMSLPRCVSEDALMPLSAMPPATRPTKAIIPQASVFDNGMNLLKPKDNAKIVEFLTDAKRMAQFAPAVSEEVSALRLEGQADRIAKANSAWAQLQQAALMQDARLREFKMLSIAADATEARCLLEENFKVQIKLLKQGKGSSKAKGLAGNNAMTALTAIAMMSRTEYAAYTLLGEEDAARLSLKQFKGFVLTNKLDNRQTLLQINSFSSEDRGQIVSGFYAIAKSIKTMELEPPEETKELPSGEGENEEVSSE